MMHRDSVMSNQLRLWRVVTWFTDVLCVTRSCLYYAFL